MQVTTFVAIMQILRLYCNYVDSDFCFSYVGGSFCCNHACDCFCCNYELQVSATLMQVTVSASNMWVTIFIVFMQVGVSVAFTQVVLSAMHICFYCRMHVTVSVITMLVTLSSNSFLFLSLTGTNFS